MANVSVSVEGSNNESASGTIDPSAKGSLEIAFEAGSGKVQVDHPKSGSTKITVSGGVSLKNLGVPIQLEGNAETDLNEGFQSADGTVTIEFSKDVKASVSVEHSESQDKVSATVSVRFG